GWARDVSVGVGGARRRGPGRARCLSQRRRRSAGERAGGRPCGGRGADLRPDRQARAGRHRVVRRDRSVGRGARRFPGPPPAQRSGQARLCTRARPQAPQSAPTGSAGGHPGHRDRRAVGTAGPSRLGRRPAQAGDRRGAGCVMTLFDAGVVGIVLLLGLICFALGFTRVILVIGGWVGGRIVAWLGFPYVQPIARAHIGIAMLADIVAGFALFVVALIVINLFTHAIARAVRGSPLRALDKSLGLLLGLGIGALGICTAFFLLNPIARAEGGSPPVWMQKSRTLPLIEWGSRT